MSNIHLKSIQSQDGKSNLQTRPASAPKATCRSINPKIQCINCQGKRKPIKLPKTAPKINQQNRAPSQFRHFRDLSMKKIRIEKFKIIHKRRRNATPLPTLTICIDHKRKQHRSNASPLTDRSMETAKLVNSNRCRSQMENRIWFQRGKSRERN